MVTFVGLYLMAVAQPALLYLVPFTLIPVFLLGLCRRELSLLWNGDGQVANVAVNVLNSYHVSISHALY